MLAFALDRRLWTFSSTGPEVVGVVIAVVGVRDTEARIGLAGVDVIGWETVVVVVAGTLEQVAVVVAGLWTEAASKAIWAALWRGRADFYKRTNQWLGTGQGCIVGLGCEQYHPP